MPGKGSKTCHTYAVFSSCRALEVSNSEMTNLQTEILTGWYELTTA